MSRKDVCGGILNDIKKALNITEEEIRRTWHDKKLLSNIDYRTFKYRYVMRKLEENGMHDLYAILKTCYLRWIGKYGK